MKTDVNQHSPFRVSLDELRETYLEKPYWVFDGDFEKQYYAKINAKSMLSVALPVSIINGMLVYGANRLLDYVEDKHSENIVRVYLIATCLFALYGGASGGGAVGIIEKVGFDLLGMSMLRYSKRAEGIKSTIFEDLMSDNDAYMERRDKYVTGKAKNRILAYMINASIIFGLGDDEKFKNLWNKYTTFERLPGLKRIEPPLKSKYIIKKIGCLTDYESGRFGETLDKCYQFRDSIREEYSLRGHGESYKELAQLIVGDWS